MLNFPDFSSRHPGPEWMDDPAARPEDLQRAYRDLTFINRYSGGARALQRALDQFAGTPPTDRPWRILDVGFGGADLWPVVRAWAARRGARVEFIGLDLLTHREFLEPGAVTANDLLLRGDALKPPLRARAVDLVISSQTLHHIAPAGIVPFLGALAGLGKQGALLVDLFRHPGPWAGIWLGTRLCGLGPMVRQDGPLSVRRGFLPEELQAIAQGAGIKIEIRRVFPGRLVIYVPPAVDGAGAASAGAAAEMPAASAAGTSSRSR